MKKGNFTLSYNKPEKRVPRKFKKEIKKYLASTTKILEEKMTQIDFNEILIDHLSTGASMVSVDNDGNLRRIEPFSQEWLKLRTEPNNAT